MGGKKLNLEVNEAQKTKISQMVANIQLAQATLENYIGAIAEDRGLLGYAFDISQMRFVKKESENDSTG